MAIPQSRILFLQPIDKNEIIAHIKSLKNTGIPGKNGITTGSIKSCHLYFIDPLIHIFNLIFTTESVPAQFKDSVVVLIYKNVKKIYLNRPIKLINNFAKIFEKCLTMRLHCYLVTDISLSKQQYEYVDGSNTTKAMFELVSNIKSSLESNKSA